MRRIHMGEQVVAAGAMGGQLSSVTTIGLNVVTIVMVAHGLNTYHGRTTPHPQSAVAMRVGGPNAQSKVADGSQAVHGSTTQTAVAIRVRGTNTQSAVATGSQALHGSTTQAAAALRSQAIKGSDPSQL